MMISLVDRQVLSLLVQPIKADLGLSDFHFSLLQGLAFVLLYTVAGLLLGYLVDKVSRRNLIMACLTTWSAATVGSGFASNFGQLFAARVVVGVGEAGMHPSAYSLLCDYYAPKHRGRAFGVLGLFGGLGLAVALLGGAAVYRLLSENHGALPAGLQAFAPWQLTFMVAGLPGLVLAVAFLAIKEPARRAISPTSDSAQGSLTRFLKSKAGLLPALLGHFALYQFICYAVLGWSPAHYMRRFDASIFEAGMITGTILTIGSFGGILTGVLGDRWIARRAFGGRLRASVVSCALGVPSLLAWFLSPVEWASILGGIVAWASFSVTLSAGPIIIADITPNQFRGRMSALYLFCVTVFGAVTGPVVVASITDFVFRDESMVHYSLAISTVAAMVVSTGLALWVMRRYSTEVYAVREEV